MFKEKIVLFASAAVFALCGTSYAQDYHHEFHDIPTPSIPQPMIPVPTVPSVPSVPQAIELPPDEVSSAPSERTTTSSSDEMSVADRAKRISELEKLTQTMANELYKMERDYLKVRKLPHEVVGSREEATSYIGIYEKSLQWLKDRIAFVQEKNASDPGFYTPNQFQDIIFSYYISMNEVGEYLAYWKVEEGIRNPAIDEPKAAYETKKAEYDKLMDELKQLKAEGEEKANTVLAATPDNSEDTGAKDKGAVSAGELGSDDFLSGNEGGLSAETVNIKRNMTMQELREEDLSRAFSDLGVADKSLTVLETANLAGQVTQTVIGFVPGMDGADVSLSIGRGFAEALGEELAKGTSMADALKIAAVNGGVKGTISYIGNKATGGTSAMTNRVAVLTQVGFDKLTTKQIAEMGAKGISYMVIKTGQTVSQEMAGAAIDPMVNKAEDALRKKNEGATKKAKTSTTYGSSGGYGSSYATQPLVSY